MTIFDIITIICGVLLIILWLSTCISEKLYPESHPKRSTAIFILSVISTMVVSVLSTTWIIDAVLT